MSAPSKSIETELERDEDVAPERSTLAEASADPTVEPTVLVIDDVPYMLDLARLFLGRTARVVTAESASAGLDLAREIQPSLILCDDVMPAMNGHQLCEAVRADPFLTRTPVVMLLSDPGADAHGAAIRAGADDVIPKPLERMPLVEAVTRLLATAQVRGLPRVDAELPVTLTTPHGEGPGTLRNVSRGGAFVETDLPLARADEVGLQFRLPEVSLTLCPNAQVVWKRARYEAEPSSDGAGLRFTEIDAATARAIDEFVYERAPMAAPGDGGP